jgi:hypothetical protein
MPVSLIDYAGLAPERHAALAESVRNQTLLAHVVAWAGPAAIAEIVTQDEYTHDVLVPHDHDLWLAYDST